MSEVRLEGERVRLLVDGGGAVRHGALERLGDGAPAGAFELHEDGEQLTIWSLCVDEAYRGYGLGSDAARLLREYAAAGPWQTLRARSHPALGLSVYFWIRMGLRPLGGDGPEGGLWFERRV